MCERCRREFNNMNSNTPVYYEKNKGWDDYVYKGVRGLKKSVWNTTSLCRF